MKRIQFNATFGLESRMVDLSSVPGACGIWHLYENNYFKAQFGKSKEGRWQVHFQKIPDWLTEADMQILCDLVEAACQQT